MRQKILFCMLIIGICGLASFNLNAFSLQEAKQVFEPYKENLLPNVWIEDGEYAFIRVTVTLPEKYKVESKRRNFAFMSEMLRVFEAYAGLPAPLPQKTPFCKNLTKLIEPLLPWKMPEIGSSILEENMTEDGVERVYAFEKEKLHAFKQGIEKQLIAREERSEEEWAALLKTAVAKLKTLPERRAVMLLLGCPLVNVLEDSGEGEFGNPILGFEKAWGELQEYLKWAKGGSPFFEAHKKILWSDIRNTDSIFYPIQWKQDDGGKFEEAKNLYNRGQDLPKVLELLSGSIALYPLKAEKWCYLGGALLANNQPQDALVAYVQAYRMAPRNDMAWKGILKSCEMAGLKEHVKGFHWYGLISKD